MSVSFLFFFINVFCFCIDQFRSDNVTIGVTSLIKQASCSPLASSRLQHSGHVDLPVTQPSSRRVPSQEEQDLDSKQRSHQKGQLRAHGRMPSQLAPSSSPTAPSTAAPIAESQQVASTRCVVWLWSYWLDPTDATRVSLRQVRFRPVCRHVHC